MSNHRRLVIVDEAENQLFAGESALDEDDAAPPTLRSPTGRESGTFARSAGVRGFFDDEERTSA